MGGTRSALIIATARYADSRLSQLRAPAKDAEALASVLGDADIGGFDVDVALDQPHGAVSRALSRFLRDRRPEDTLLLHLSCHGIKDEHGELYFAASDTERDDLDATAIAAVWLRRLMDKCRSRRTLLMLDCCFSGAFGRGMLARGDAAVHTRERLDGRGRAIITASDSLEYALEGEGEEAVGQPSVFTSAVVAGLASGAADRDGDGLITVPELFRHVEEAVREATPYMTPHLWMLDVEGELVIARSRSANRENMSLAAIERLAQSALMEERREAVELLGGRLTGGAPDDAAAARRALGRLAYDDSQLVSAAAALALQPLENPTLAAWTFKRPRVATYVRHEERVRDVALDPCGERLATASSDGTGRLWSLEGEELLRLSHGGEVQAIAFTPDGQRLVTAGAGGARIWAINRGAQLASVGHDGTARAVAVSPDGELVVSAGDDHKARLWNKAGETVAVLEHDASVWAVAFASDGSLLATASTDTTARLWTTAGDLIASLRHSGAVWGVALSPDGRLVATASGDKRAHLWKLADPREPRTLHHDSAVRCVVFSPDGEVLVSCGDDGTARGWNVRGGYELARLPHDDAVPRACFTHGGQLLATASLDRYARLWDCMSGNLVARFPHDAPVTRVSFSGDDRVLATAAGATAQLWHAHD
jgi:WD40 repeat protein